jgi:hypothetical protein
MKRKKRKFRVIFIIYIIHVLFVKSVIKIYRIRFIIHQIHMMKIFNNLDFSVKIVMKQQQPYVLYAFFSLLIIPSIIACRSVLSLRMI